MIDPEEMTMEDFFEFTNYAMELAERIGEAVSERKDTGDTAALDKIEMSVYDYYFKITAIVDYDPWKDGP